MIVFYRNIIDRIRLGAKHKYQDKHLVKLNQWSENDIRSAVEIDLERKI